MTGILVIKLGALGDFVMATPAFAAIRAHHKNEKLTLLTIPGLISLARATGLFDEVLEDPRGAWPIGHWCIAQRLRFSEFKFVYDLQGTTRTAWYWRLLWPTRPSWAGPVAGCSHPRPSRPQGHRMDWYRAQLAALSITVSERINLDWLQGDLRSLQIPARYVLIVPGGSAHRSEKRWPAAAYTAVARALLNQQITPVLIGTQVDFEANDFIARQVPQSFNLTDRTSLGQLASLARGALAAIGNDTGPMHVIAAAGAPTVTLFSEASDPGFIGPRGPQVRCVQMSSLRDLAPATVLEALAECAGITAS
ncbi:MAG: lipopolysaccharide heptosyltransferase family protein [Gammaproteobacteria bacterium]|nr:lipopolysaccharide heptosyltransferase family protein [Gammaproteobacteria bacterium]